MGKKAKIEKNLANCTPREFLTQTNKIRKAAAAWLTATDIMNIRRNRPKLKELPPNASPEEIDKIMTENADRTRDVQMSNLSKMYAAIADEHPEETLELMALVCFVDPADLDKYSVSDLMRNITEMLSNEDVVSFFISLMRLVNLNTLTSSKR